MASKTSIKGHTYDFSLATLINLFIELQYYAYNTTVLAVALPTQTKTEHLLGTRFLQVTDPPPYYPLS